MGATIPQAAVATTLRAGAATTPRAGAAIIRQAEEAAVRITPLEEALTTGTTLPAGTVRVQARAQADHR